MAEIKIYTMNRCPFCDAAKKLLTSRGLKFTETKLGDDDDDAWDALTQKTGMKTAPQIFHGEKLIGGFDDLSKLDKQDQLASLKA